MTKKAPIPSAPPLAPDRTPVARIEADSSETDVLHTLGAIAKSLPDPRELAPGSWIALVDRPLPKRGLVDRLFGSAPSGVHLAVRCTALAVRGYVHVCATADGQAFGQAP
jgi:hypothetical protein